MNWIDLAILIIVGLSAYRGFRTGFIRQVVSVIALLLAGYLSSRVAMYLEPGILRYFEISPRTLRVVSLTLSFIVIVICVRMAGRWLERLVSFSIIRLINRVLGAIIAPLVFLSLLSILFLLVDTIFPPENPKGSVSQDIRKESRFYAPVRGIIPTLLLLNEETLKIQLEDIQEVNRLRLPHAIRRE